MTTISQLRVLGKFQDFCKDRQDMIQLFIFLYGDSVGLAIKKMLHSGAANKCYRGFHSGNIQNVLDRVILMEHLKADHQQQTFNKILIGICIELKNNPEEF